MKTTKNETILCSEQIEQFAKVITDNEFIALYESGIINDDMTDFEMAIYKNVVNKIIKDSKK